MFFFSGLLSKSTAHQTLLPLTESKTLPLLPLRLALDDTEGTGVDNALYGPDPLQDKAVQFAEVPGLYFGNEIVFPEKRIYLHYPGNELELGICLVFPARCRVDENETDGHGDHRAARVLYPDVPGATICFRKGFMEKTRGSWRRI